MAYRFIVHIVKRPNLLPQKVQDFYTLVNQGCRVFPVKWMNKKDNSMLCREGEVALVDMYGCLELTDDGECVISENDDAELSMIEMCFIAQIIDSFDLGSGVDVGDYMLSDFFWNHGVAVRANCLYAISAEQVAAIDRKVVGLNLQQQLSGDVAVAIEFR